MVSQLATIASVVVAAYLKPLALHVNVVYVGDAEEEINRITVISLRVWNTVFSSDGKL
jgi:hypothetical protein